MRDPGCRCCVVTTSGDCGAHGPVPLSTLVRSAEDPVLVPARLLPYLQELLATGLYGATVEDVVTNLLETAIQIAVRDGDVRLRHRGRVARR